MRLALIHQHDPTVPHVGGIQTFINTLIRNAPDDLDVDLLGVSSRPEAYPVGQWHALTMGAKAFRFFPLVAAHPVEISRIPLSFKMLLALYRYRRRLALNGAILEFHRIEPMLGFLFAANEKVLFLHGNNRKDFYNRKTEVRWGRCPALYFFLEAWLLRRARHVYTVREDAVHDYRLAFPDMDNAISFLPTWVDEMVFSALSPVDRENLRMRLLREQNLPLESKVLLFVGRYEGQKDPFRLLEAFRLVAERRRVCLILIGEGTLKEPMRRFVVDNGLSDVVRFMPPMDQSGVSEWMNAADGLCLSSAFEGMPRVVVEALHCGLPVVGTAVGETVRLIGGTRGGRLVAEAGASAFAAAVLDLLADPPSADCCRRQVHDFTARKILEPVYHHYRCLSSTP